MLKVVPRTSDTEFMAPDRSPSTQRQDHNAASPPLTSNSFPGGRVKLPRLDPVEPGSREFSIVGTAFVRDRRPETVESGRQSTFTEYFTHESLFHETNEISGTDVDPFAVLGVSRDADWATITAAHRKLLRSNHPDLVASLGREAQREAETKSKQLNEAYATLRQLFQSEQV